MNSLIKSIEGEYRRYKTLAEGALEQVAEPQLSAPGPASGNSLATICWHVSGRSHGASAMKNSIGGRSREASY